MYDNIKFEINVECFWYFELGIYIFLGGFWNLFIVLIVFKNVVCFLLVSWFG